MNTHKFKKDLGYRGYIFSRDIKGNFIPQRVQNLVIKDFCKRKNLFFKLSSAEYIMENSFLMLRSILKDVKLIDGVVFYSIEMLPSKKKLREDILNNLIKNKKKIFFALEEIEINHIKAIKKIDMLINIKDAYMKDNLIKKNKSLFKY
ncbi:LIC12192 family sporadic carbohydrate cluster protein [Candidatus Pelagibacter bacterium nBUS_32]|uniref:LIC12192 family sporadic carbohydrate cluster protein n=1 Tax=Candidatus Pelagibacter bacterium nBUS_32 TaxID=3374192 RepID=UPI003EBA3D76